MWFYIFWSLSTIYILSVMKYNCLNTLFIKHHNVKVLMSNDEICHICLEGFDKNKALCIPNCGHTIHLSCFKKLIESSLNTKNQCGQCKCVIFENNRENQERLTVSNERTIRSTIGHRFGPYTTAPTISPTLAPHSRIRVTRVLRRFNINNPTNRISLIDDPDEIDTS